MKALKHQLKHQLKQMLDMTLSGCSPAVGGRMGNDTMMR